MRKLITVFVGLTLIMSCQSHSKSGNSTSLEEKKKRLQKLRQDLLKLQNEIAELEQAIKAEDKSYGQHKPVAVGYIVVRPQFFTSFLQFQGTVDNKQVITLTGKIMAPVTRIYVQEGHKVAAGQVLLEQEAEVLRRNLAEVRTRLELATTLYEKQKKLYEEGIGAEVQYLTAKNNKEALEATVATLEEQLRNAQIRAPFPGKVDAIQIRVGEMLGPGIPAIRLASTGQWEIRAEIPESYLEIARPGKRVEVHVPDLALSFEGRISTVSENINPLSRTFSIIVRDIPPAYSTQLRPNLIAYVRLPEKEIPQALVVPTDAIQFQDEGTFVYVSQGGVAHKRAVSVLGTQGIYSAVKGLNPGDTVITVGASLLTEGQHVLLSLNQ
ncbi:MAG: efflux RND transporter periplasmic adaptor subunit [Bacteroidia bacterium]|nr:efflux RND transporter periplasmic adaptor subunit [Bacteroidia bacterium]